MLVVVALVGMSESMLAATFLGICTEKSCGFPIYCSVCTIRLVVLLLALDICLRDDSLSIHCTIPSLSLGISAHSHGDLDELCSLFEGSALRLLNLQAHLCSNPWLPWIAPWRPWMNSHQDHWITRSRV